MSRACAFPRLARRSLMHYTVYRGELQDIRELAFRDAERPGGFQRIELYWEPRRAPGEWKPRSCPVSPTNGTPSRVPPRYTDPSRTHALAYRDDSCLGTMVGLNYYIAPSYWETTVKVSRFCGAIVIPLSLSLVPCLRTYAVFTVQGRYDTLTQYNYSTSAHAATCARAN